MDKIKRDQQLLDDVSPGEKTTRFLSCELTDDEQRERGVQSANAYDEINRLKTEAKGIADEYRSKIIGAESKHDSLKNTVLQKREYREVDCTEYHDYKKGKVYTVRDDLVLITESRQMTPDERQAVLLPGIRAESLVDRVASELDGKKGHAFKAVMGSKDCGLCNLSKGDVFHSESMRGVSIEGVDGKKKTGKAARAATATA